MVLCPCVGRKLGESVFLRAKLRFFEAETSRAPFQGKAATSLPITRFMHNWAAGRHYGGCRQPLAGSHSRGALYF